MIAEPLHSFFAMKSFHPGKLSDMQFRDLVEHLDQTCAQGVDRFYVQVDSAAGIKKDGQF